jgi:hypothetical protein
LIQIAYFGRVTVAPCAKDMKTGEAVKEGQRTRKSPVPLALLDSCFSNAAAYAGAIPEFEMFWGSNEETNTMISCNCPDAIRSGALCKHMFLVNRMERIGFPETANHQEEASHQQQQQDTQPQPLLSDAMTR